MKKLLLITSAALIGLASQATAALTITDVAATDLATELRGLNSTDWAVVTTSGMLNTSMGTFLKNNAIDDGPVTFMPGDSVVVESIYKKAIFQNDFGVVMDDGFGPILTNLDLNESKMIANETDGDLVKLLGFATDVGGSSTEAAGIVSSADNDNVWTFTNPGNAGGLGDVNYVLWLLEDFDLEADRRDDDFNDFIVLGTISAVPEPSTIISLIAVGFLGFVTWRNRRKAKA